MKKRMRLLLSLLGVAVLIVGCGEKIPVAKGTPTFGRMLSLIEKHRVTAPLAGLKEQEIWSGQCLTADGPESSWPAAISVDTKKAKMIVLSGSISDSKPIPSSEPELKKLLSDESLRLDRGDKQGLILARADYTDSADKSTLVSKPGTVSGRREKLSLSVGWMKTASNYRILYLLGKDSGDALAVACYFSTDVLSKDAKTNKAATQDISDMLRPSARKAGDQRIPLR